jgi:hypothetical protein
VSDTIVKVHVADGQWARSEFPHPLVTLDFSADDKLLAVSCPADSVTSYGPMNFAAVESGGC